MRKKLLLSDSAVRILLAVRNKPGITTGEIAKKIKAKRLPTIYTSLASLNDRGFFSVEEKHSGNDRDGRPRYAYTLSKKGFLCAELYKQLFELEATKQVSTNPKSRT